MLEDPNRGFDDTDCPGIGVLDELAQHNRLTLSGVFYGGVGLGIVATGMLVPAIGDSIGWQGTWLGSMVLTVLLGIPSILWMRDRVTTLESQSKR